MPPSALFHSPITKFRLFNLTRYPPPRGAASFVILGGTFFAYILMMIGQRHCVRPLSVCITMYNRLSVLLSLFYWAWVLSDRQRTGRRIGILRSVHRHQSKSREQMLAEQTVQKTGTNHSCCNPPTRRFI